MAHTTIDQFATELKLPPGALLEQLAKAGVDGKKQGDNLSEHDKTKLLEYLQKQHGAAGEPKKKITLTRKQTSEIKAAGSTGKARTIQVEVRKKRRIRQARRARGAAGRRRSPEGAAGTADLRRGARGARSRGKGRRRSDRQAAGGKCRISRNRGRSGKTKTEARPRKPRQRPRPKRAVRVAAEAKPRAGQGG
jgi:translation initiation factor IF-2